MTYKLAWRAGRLQAVVTDHHWFITVSRDSMGLREDLYLDMCLLNINLSRMPL